MVLHAGHCTQRCGPHPNDVNLHLVVPGFQRHFLVAAVAGFPVAEARVAGEVVGSGEFRLRHYAAFAKVVGYIAAVSWCDTCHRQSCLIVSDRTCRGIKRGRISLICSKLG